MTSVIHEVQHVYIQTSIVKKIEERFRTEWVSGQGKDAMTKEVSDGWWIIFIDNPTAIQCNVKPDCKPGDKATCTWEFSR